MISWPRRILFSLAVFGDIVSLLPTNKRQSWNFWFGNYNRTDRFFSRQSFANTVSRLLKTRRIEKEVKKGRVRISITPRGLEFLSMRLDLDKFSRKKWDGKWRVVIFDIPEKKRKRRDDLRDQIKGLGFGMLQESVWISPFPIEEELVELFSSSKIYGQVLVSRSHILVGDQKAMVSQVWSLDKLDRSYRRLGEGWAELSPGQRNKAAAYEFQRIYFELLWSDPFLPKELLPDSWKAEKLKKLYFKEVTKVLSA